MIANEPKLAVSYLRRSTDLQAQSLGDQRKEIARWAGENGYELVKEYVDDAISGTSARARPGFQQMIADAPKGGFEAVIVWNSDRFSRGSVTETEHYRFLLQEAGVVVVSVTETFLADEGIAGDVLRAVKQFQNRQYSISLSQNTLRGQISAVLAASDPGRMPPYGYDREIVGPDGSVQYRVRFMPGGHRHMLDRDGKLIGTYGPGQTLRKPGKESKARLVLSAPERVQAVRDIYQLCLDGYGFKAIADELNKRGLMSPKGKLWQFTTIKPLIENPTYRGDVVWNRRTESKFYEVRQGRADKMKPTVKSGRVERVSRDDWVVIENAVPPLVDRRTWDKAQIAAAKRADCEGGRGRRENRWLLSGVLKCACCGQPFWGVDKKKGIKPGQKPVVTPYYICAGRGRSGKAVCPDAAHVRARDLETWVLARLREMIMGDAEGVAQAIDRFVAALRTSKSGPGTADLSRELAHIDATVNALLTGLDPANLPLINDRLSQLRRRKEYLQAQIRDAEADSVDEKALRKWATERIGLLIQITVGRRDEEARRALASYVDEIRIDPATKTGVLVVNANIAALASGAGLVGIKTKAAGVDAAELGESSSGSAASGAQESRSGQKGNDPAGAGSYATAIAGAGFEPATSGL